MVDRVVLPDGSRAAIAYAVLRMKHALYVFRSVGSFCANFAGAPQVNLSPVSIWIRDPPCLDSRAVLHVQAFVSGAICSIPVSDIFRILLTPTLFLGEPLFRVRLAPLPVPFSHLLRIFCPTLCGVFTTTLKHLIPMLQFRSSIPIPRLLRVASLPIRGANNTFSVPGVPLRNVSLQTSTTLKVKHQPIGLRLLPGNDGTGVCNNGVSHAVISAIDDEMVRGLGRLQSLGASLILLRKDA